MIIPPYKVIQDDREKKPWVFYKTRRCSGVEVVRLQFGDYTIKGLEKLFIVERKGSVSELYVNFGKYRKQFMRQVAGMSKIPYRFLVVEATLASVLHKPPYGRVPTSVVSGSLISIMAKNHIPVLFIGTGRKAKQFIRHLFLKMWEYHCKGEL